MICACALACCWAAMAAAVACIDARPCQFKIFGCLLCLHALLGRHRSSGGGLVLQAKERSLRLGVDLRLRDRALLGGHKRRLFVRPSLRDKLGVSCRFLRDQSLSARHCLGNGELLLPLLQNFRNLDRDIRVGPALCPDSLDGSRALPRSRAAAWPAILFAIQSATCVIGQPLLGLYLAPAQERLRLHPH